MKGDEGMLIGPVLGLLLLGLTAISCVIGGSTAESPRKNKETKKD